MAFKFEKTKFEGLMVITPHMYPDNRGLYKSIMKKMFLQKMESHVSLLKAVI